MRQEPIERHNQKNDERCENSCNVAVQERQRCCGKVRQHGQTPVEVGSSIPDYIFFALPLERAIFEVDEDNSHEYDFLLTEEQEDNIAGYGRIYISTPVHIIELIDEKIELINELKIDIEKLKNKLIK